MVMGFKRARKNTASTTFEPTLGVMNSIRRLRTAFSLFVNLFLVIYKFLINIKSVRD